MGNVEKCKHQHYKTDRYMTAGAALAAMKRSEAARTSAVIQKCDQCGEDIAWAKVVRVTTPTALYRELGVSLRVTKKAGRR